MTFLNKNNLNAFNFLQNNDEANSVNSLNNVSINSFIFEAFNIENRKTSFTVFSALRYLKYLKDNKKEITEVSLKTYETYLVSTVTGVGKVNFIRMVQSYQEKLSNVRSNFDVDDKGEYLNGVVNICEFPYIVRSETEGEDGPQVLTNESIYYLCLSKSEIPLANYLRLFIMFMISAFEGSGTKLPTVKFGDKEFLYFDSIITFFDQCLYNLAKIFSKLELSPTNFLIPKSSFFKLLISVGHGIQSHKLIFANKIGFNDFDMKQRSILFKVNDDRNMIDSIKVSCDHCLSKPSTFSIFISESGSSDSYFDPLATLNSYVMAEASNIPLWTNDHNKCSPSELNRLNKYFLNDDRKSVPQMSCGYIIKEDGTKYYLKYLTHHRHLDLESHAHFRLCSINNLFGLHILSSDMYKFDNASSALRNRFTTFLTSHQKGLKKGALAQLSPNYKFFSQINNKQLFTCFNYMRLSKHYDMHACLATKFKLSLIRSIIKLSDSSQDVVCIPYYIYACLSLGVIADYDKLMNSKICHLDVVTFFKANVDKEKNILAEILKLRVENSMIEQATEIYNLEVNLESCSCSLCVGVIAEKANSYLKMISKYKPIDLCLPQGDVVELIVDHNQNYVTNEQTYEVMKTMPKGFSTINLKQFYSADFSTSVYTLDNLQLLQIGMYELYSGEFSFEKFRPISTLMLKDFVREESKVNLVKLIDIPDHVPKIDFFANEELNRTFDELIAIRKVERKKINEEKEKAKIDTNVQNDSNEPKKVENFDWCEASIEIVDEKENQKEINRERTRIKKSGYRQLTQEENSRLGQFESKRNYYNNADRKEKYRNRDRFDDRYNRNQDRSRGQNRNKRHGGNGYNRQYNGNNNNNYRNNNNYNEGDGANDNNASEPQDNRSNRNHDDNYFDGGDRRNQNQNQNQNQNNSQNYRNNNYNNNRNEERAFNKQQNQNKSNQISELSMPSSGAQFKTPGGDRRY